MLSIQPCRTTNRDGCGTLSQFSGTAETLQLCSIWRTLWTRLALSIF
jgi:hypothetical protein